MLHANEMLDYMLHVGGTDLYVKVGSEPRVRVGGEVLSAPFGAPTAGDVESLARSLLPPNREEQLDSTGQVDFAMSLPGLGRFRVSLSRQRGTLMVVFRRVVPGVPRLDQLALPGVVAGLAESASGLLLVTGPRGQGVSTTVAAVVDHVNRTRAATIVTVEDPVEFLHQDQLSIVAQREIGTDTRGYRDAIQAVSRQNPDVVVLGELVDSETAWFAVSAAAMGQLVISTLRTGTAEEAVVRLLELIPEENRAVARRSLAGSLRGVLCQRLLWRAGDVGRVPAVEVLVGTDEVADRVRSGSLSFSDLVEGGDRGMRSLDQSLLSLVEEGWVTHREALSVSLRPKWLMGEFDRLADEAAAAERLAGAVDADAGGDEPVGQAGGDGDGG